MTFENGALHFHCSLNPTSHVAVLLALVNGVFLKTRANVDSSLPYTFPTGPSIPNSLYPDLFQILTWLPDPRRQFFEFSKLAKACWSPALRNHWKQKQKLKRQGWTKGRSWYQIHTHSLSFFVPVNRLNDSHRYQGTWDTWTAQPDIFLHEPKCSEEQLNFLFSVWMLCWPPRRKAWGWYAEREKVVSCTRES